MQKRSYVLRSLKIVSRLGLIECYLQQGNIKKETGAETEEYFLVFLGGCVTPMENLPVPFAPNNHFKGLTYHGPAFLESQVDFVIFHDSQKSIVYEVLVNTQCPFCNIMPLCLLNSSLYLVLIIY